MKRILIVIAVAALPLTVFAADGPAVFKARCAMCHGATGAGDTPMGKKLALKPLASQDTQKKTDAKLQETITKGRDKMPAFGTKLTAAEIQSLVAVLRGFAK